MIAAIGTYLTLRFAFVALSAVLAFATIFTLALSLTSRNKLQQRMTALNEEREQVRKQAQYDKNVKVTRTLTQDPGMSIRRVVETFNLFKLVEEGKIRQSLRRAGLRSKKYVYVFAIFRSALPIAFFIAAYAYFYIFSDFGLSNLAYFTFALAAAGFGFYLPNIYVHNLVTKRQDEIRRSFPDALDLLLICIEAGQSVEVAFNRVSNEFATESPALSEEFNVTTAELSYLQDRRKAFENMSDRIGLTSVRAVCGGLIQSEVYGTSLGQVLRTMAQESRDDRLNAAEKKAAALPPKLTVPMILFFLPGLFIIILGPAAVSYFAG